KESLAPSDRGPSQVRWIDVAEEEAGQRIDNYLAARLKGVPKSLIYRILRSGEVRVNSRRVAPSDRVAAGDRIRIPPVRVAERDERTPAPRLNLAVLFEDEALLAIDKPAGLAVHGGSGVAHGRGQARLGVGGRPAGRDDAAAPCARRALQPPRSRAPHRPHAPDPGAPRAPGPSGARRREVRRFRAQPGGAQARLEAHVPPR